MSLGKLRPIFEMLALVALAFAARFAFLLATHREILVRAGEKLTDEKLISSAELMLEEVEHII